MHAVAIGFWGAFFGTAALLLIGSLAAYVQSHHRVALTAALTAVASALFALTYLGWLPTASAEHDNRLAAHVSIFTALLLGLMLLLDLGLLRERENRRRILAGMAALGLALFGVSWLLDPRQSVIYGTVVAIAFSLMALLVGVRSARGGDRIAWFGVLGVGCLQVALVSGILIVLYRDGVAWQVHAVSATAGMAYLIGIALMMWRRYSYLIELREVLALGPRYDPITRMQSTGATGHMIAQAFSRQHQSSTRSLNLIGVAIGNLYALEKLHGRSALNHALFVCAGRLRRCVPADVEMGRLFDDGFLLIARNATDPQRLVRLGRELAQRLSRPVMLRTGALEGGEGQTEWAAQVGVGLLATTADAQPAAEVAKVRDMARTAWSFPSRVAWHDRDANTISELGVATTR
jgi:GGDEF domain-containing protein